jgi:YidC/Oxa1 family membrane protein insertase
VVGNNCYWWVAREEVSRSFVLGTVVLRLALFRVPILNQRNVAEMNKHMPFSDANRKKISDARAEGNKMLEAQAMMEMREYQQKQKMNPLKALWLGCGNALIFMTQYFALKKMAAANFPGFSTEGTLWFPDLTITDPYYALPAITAITTGLVIKLGIEFGFAANALQGWQRIAVQYGMPAMIFFGNWFMDFPSAILLYWCTSNFITLFYAGLFRVPTVRRWLNIPDVVQYKRKESPFNFKQTFKKQKQASTIYDMQKKDSEKFKRAGQGKPAVKQI